MVILSIFLGKIYVDIEFINIKHIKRNAIDFFQKCFKIYRKFLIFNLFIKIIIQYLYISIKLNKNHYDIIKGKIHKKFYFNLICFIGFLFNFLNKKNL